MTVYSTIVSDDLTFCCIHGHAEQSGTGQVAKEHLQTLFPPRPRHPSVPIKPSMIEYPTLQQEYVAVFDLCNAIEK